MSNFDKKTEKDIQEAYEDLVFRKVMAYYIQNQYEKSKNLICETNDTKKIERLYNKCERKENWGIVLGFSKKAMRFIATIVLIAVVSLATSVITFADVRETVAEILYHIITNDQKIYTEINKGEITGFIDPEIYDWDGAYAPTYIPKGYTLSQKIDLDVEQMVIYENDNRYIRFFQSNDPSSSTIDTEDAKVEKIAINDSEAFFVKEGEFISIYWYHGNKFLFIESTADIDDTILVAKGIKKIG